MSDVDVSNVELVESLLNTDIDNVEDLPEFKLFPKGVYKFKCDKMEVATDNENDKAAIKAIFSSRETLETVDELREEDLPEEGSLLGQMWGSKFGVQKFKQVFGSCFSGLNCRTMAEFIEQAEGLEFVMTVGHRKDNQDRTDDDGNPMVYNTVKTAILAED